MRWRSWMSLDKELLEILACPACKSSIKEEGEWLLCSKCRLKFPIRNGIPVMLLDEAQKF
jgi:uncharacterized protein